MSWQDAVEFCAKEGRTLRYDRFGLDEQKSGLFWTRIYGMERFVTLIGEIISYLKHSNQCTEGSKYIIVDIRVRIVPQCPLIVVQDDEMEQSVTKYILIVTIVNNYTVI